MSSFASSASSHRNRVPASGERVRLDRALHRHERRVPARPLRQERRRVQRRPRLLLQRHVPHHDRAVQAALGSQVGAGRRRLLSAVQHGRNSFRQLRREQICWRPQEMRKRVSLVDFFLGHVHTFSYFKMDVPFHFISTIIQLQNELINVS